jgi:hypothetical protein
MNNPEVFKGVESTSELEKVAGEQLEKLTQLERSAEHSPEAQAERADNARHDAKEVFAREAGKERETQAASQSPRAIRKVTKKEKEVSYKNTMKQIQSEMNPVARGFSKVIHAPAVEKTAQVVGGTIARPNALLAGGAAAFLFVLVAYFVAKKYGYALSGFETIGAFILGWALGLIYDYAKLMFAGRRP